MIFGGTDQQDHTISIFTSDNGSAGTKISIHRAALLSALTITDNGTTYVSEEFGEQTNRTGTGAVGATDNVFSFAAAESSDVFDLDAYVHESV